MSVTISIRIEEEVKTEIENMGYKPGEYVKMLLERDLSKERTRNALKWLKENMLPEGGENAEDMIRRDRDSR